jgi:hypothetical protein
MLKDARHEGLGQPKGTPIFDGAVADMLQEALGGPAKELFSMFGMDVPEGLKDLSVEGAIQAIQMSTAFVPADKARRYLSRVGFSFLPDDGATDIDEKGYIRHGGILGHVMGLDSAKIPVFYYGLATSPFDGDDDRLETVMVLAEEHLLEVGAPQAVIFQGHPLFQIDADPNSGAVKRLAVFGGWVFDPSSEHDEWTPFLLNGRGFAGALEQRPHFKSDDLSRALVRHHGLDAAFMNHLQDWAVEVDSAKASQSGMEPSMSRQRLRTVGIGKWRAIMNDQIMDMVEGIAGLANRNAGAASEFDQDIDQESDDGYFDDIEFSIDDVPHNLTHIQSFAIHPEVMERVYEDVPLEGVYEALYEILDVVSEFLLYEEVDEEMRRFLPQPGSGRDLEMFCWSIYFRLRAFDGWEKTSNIPKGFLQLLSDSPEKAFLSLGACVLLAGTSPYEVLLDEADLERRISSYRTGNLLDRIDPRATRTTRLKLPRRAIEGILELALEDAAPLVIHDMSGFLRAGASPLAENEIVYAVHAISSLCAPADELGLNISTCIVTGHENVGKLAKILEQNPPAWSADAQCFLYDRSGPLREKIIRLGRKILAEGRHNLAREEGQVLHEASHVTVPAPYMMWSLTKVLEHGGNFESCSDELLEGAATFGTGAGGNRQAQHLLCTACIIRIIALFNAIAGDRDFAMKVRPNDHSAEKYYEFCKVVAGYDLVEEQGGRKFKTGFEEMAVAAIRGLR